MSEERTYDRTITTQLELRALVSEALVTGVLNLYECKIDVDFYLVELLLAFGQTKVPCENNRFIQNTVVCPFVIEAEYACFKQAVITTTIDTNVIFTKDINYSNTIFTKKAYFWSSTFMEGADFHDTLFEEEVMFYRTIFHRDAEFGSVLFKKEVNFSYSSFLKKANFQYSCFTKEIDFSNTDLAGNVDFSNSSFIGALKLIPRSTKGSIIFCEPKLESEQNSLVVDLGLLVSPLVLYPLLELFYQSFTYISCFLYFLTLSRYLSQGLIFFYKTEVGHDRMCLKIRNLKKDSIVRVHFKDCGFYAKNVAFTNVDMQNVSIKDGNDVSGMAFYRCRWAKEPAFFGLKFRAFDGLKTEDIPKKAESYGNLKVSALDAGNAQLSNDFHFWHQWHQWENLYRKRLWNWNNFYRITSAYGMSVRLPLFWFICVIGIFIFFYAPITKVPQPTLMFAFRTSIENSLPLIGWTRSSLFNTHPTQYLLLSILQHLIQGYLLFQIGAAIRNKVKR